MDFVMNHTSEDHEWAKRALAGEKEYQDRYFSMIHRTFRRSLKNRAPGISDNGAR